MCTCMCNWDPMLYSEKKKLKKLQIFIEFSSDIRNYRFLDNFPPSC